MDMELSGLELSSLSISKGSVYEEMTMTQAAMEDALSRHEDTISNERIQKGDRILDTYTVQDDAISGGMGSVWRVHHENWNTDLAMKRPQPRFFAEGSQKRKAEFISECENWINMGLHPNIVSCYYVREIGGVPTIFSEWMDNGSLKDRIRDGSLYQGTEAEVQERILDIAAQTARGLAYSHEKGLIHQDIKPGNILLSKNWDAKIADFGLARARSQMESGNTLSTGYTLEYCPKEQAEGAAPEAWMDIYAWALTVLEMYCGGRKWESGALAPEFYTRNLNGVRILIPEQIRELLSKLFAVNRLLIPNMAHVDAELRDLLRIFFNKEIRYQKFKPADSLPGILNNRALSFVDLGMTEDAVACWEHAVQIDEGHEESLLNRQLMLSRIGKTHSQESVNVLRRYYERTHSALTARTLITFLTEVGLYDEAQVFSEKEKMVTALQQTPEWQRNVQEYTPKIMPIGIADADSIRSVAFTDENTIYFTANPNLYRIDIPSKEITQVRQPVGMMANNLISDNRGGFFAYGDSSIPSNNILFIAISTSDICYYNGTEFTRKYHAVPNDVLCFDGKSTFPVKPTKTQIRYAWLSENGETLHAVVINEFRGSFDDYACTYYHHAWNVDDPDTTVIERLHDRDDLLVSLNYNSFTNRDFLSPSGRYKVRIDQKQCDVRLTENNRGIKLIHFPPKMNNTRHYGNGSFCFSPDEKYFAIPKVHSEASITVYKMPDSLIAAPYILSEIVDIEKAEMLRQEKSRLFKEFTDAASQENVHHALDIFEEYRVLLGCENTEDSIRMEKWISEHCIRTGIHHVLTEPLREFIPDRKVIFDTAGKEVSEDCSHIIKKLIKSNPTFFDLNEKTKVKFDKFFDSGSYIRADGKVLWCDYSNCNKCTNDIYRFNIQDKTLEHTAWISPCRFPKNEISPDGNVYIHYLSDSDYPHIMGDPNEKERAEKYELYLNKSGEAVRQLGAFDQYPRTLFSPDSRFLFCEATVDGIENIFIYNTFNEACYISAVEKDGLEITQISDDGFYLYGNRDNSDNKTHSHTALCLRVSYYYSVPESTAWNPKADFILDIFLKEHPRYTAHNELELLYKELTNRGFGWIQKEAILSRLNEKEKKNRWHFLSRF